MKMDLVLDLDNFDSQEAEGSRYVLTSPRSLEACARMRIRPVQLLPKTIDEFVEENPGKPLPLLQVFHDNHELKRIELLQRCKEIRQTIIMENKVQSKKDNSSKIGSTKITPRSKTLPRMKSEKASSKETLSQSKSVGNKFDHDENNNPEEVNNTYEVIPTIPNTSPRNPKKLLKQSLTPQKFGQRLTPRQGANFVKSKSRSEANLEEPYMISTPVAAKHSSSRKSLERTGRSMLGDSSSLRSRSLSDRHWQDRKRSRSLDYSKVKPFKGADMELASSMKFASSQFMSGCSTPQKQKDQKILEVMKDKRKQQENEARKISEKQKEWVDEKRKEERRKLQDQLEKDRSLRQSHLEWEKRMKEKEDRRVREIKRNEQEKLTLIEETEKQIERKRKEQERIQRAIIEERRKSELLRKQQQEAAKHTVEKEVKAFQEATEREIDTKLDKAQRTKLEMEMKEINKLQYLNKSQREKFLKLENELKKRKDEDEERLKTELQKRMEKAEILRTRKIEAREQSLRLQAKEEDERMQRTKEKHETLNKKNDEYLQSIAEHKKELLKKANSTLMQNIQTKSKRAQQLREVSQEEQKRRLKQIEEEEKKYLSETKDFLEAKDYRSKTHQQLKEAAIQLSRANARAAEAARSEVKQKDDTFLQSHNHAALISSIGRGPRTGLVNASTVKLG
uniref:coiled-coil domain-containing protein 177-like isoform X1 n=1 Tax=Styela clava TaxID=7725 RepID=UPI001939792F|nr:coiled-coil domain-containing protein 177-like isoform X1 [Styela clava]